MMLQLPEERRERTTQKERTKKIEKQQYLNEQAPKKKNKQKCKTS